MITYYHQNKGRFSSCEDSFTSTVFDLLKYLPSQVFWDIFRKSMYYQKLPKVSGEIQEFAYWPKWDPVNTGNSNYVEPDIFIRFEEFDLIIEAKVLEEGQQCEYQAMREIQAYYNEYGDDEKDFYFIQVGGLQSLNEETVRVKGQNIMIFKTDWTKILGQVVFEKDKLANISFSQINSYKRILEDLIKGFELHGHYKKLWLDSLESIFISTQISNTFFNYVTKH